MDSKRIVSMVIGFLVLTGIFFVIERLGRGIKTQRILRRGFWTDLIYWFFTPLVTKSITKLGVILPAVFVVLMVGISFEELKNPGYRGFGLLSQQPLWLQGIEVFVLGDFIGYWTHRLFHTGKWWTFHAVHHSSVEMDWLSSVRLHPVNDFVSKLAQMFPLLLLGFNPRVLAAYAPVLTFYAILLHANVNWTYGPLRAVIASPVFHRWHHTKEAEAMDKNFAGFFPFLDILFGTYYMPKDKFPTVFGIDTDDMPENIAGQLAYPFRRPAREAQAEGKAQAEQGV
jgi:sterol desaturase/sphingolipid hydroxylase (fatty acid hydroxylase superfamily)